MFIHDCVKQILEDKRQREAERDQPVYANPGLGKYPLHIHVAQVSYPCDKLAAFLKDPSYVEIRH